MPDPKKYSDKQDWMDDCMHQNVKEEGKLQGQSVAICLNTWRSKNKKKGKKKASDALRCAAAALTDEPIVKGTLTKSSGEPAVRFTVEEARKHNLYQAIKGKVINLNGKKRIRLVAPVTVNGTLWVYTEIE